MSERDRLIEYRWLTEMGLLGELGAHAFPLVLWCRAVVMTEMGVVDHLGAWFRGYRLRVSTKMWLWGEIPLRALLVSRCLLACSVGVMLCDLVW